MENATVNTKLVYGKHMNTPFLSILIPTVRVNELAIEAVKSALNQKEPNCLYEVILLINNPDFNSYEILPKDERLVVYQNDIMLDMKSNISHCADLSNATYISFLHDDDLLLDSFIKKMTIQLNKRHFDCLIPERYLIYSDTEFGKSLKKKAKTKQTLSSLLFFRYFYRRKIQRINNEDNFKIMENCFCAPTCGITFDREVFIATNGFESKSKYAFDFDYLFRLNETHEVFILRNKLGIYRMTDSATNKPEVQFDFYLFWLKLVEESQNKYVLKNKKHIEVLLYEIWDEPTRKLILSSGYKIPEVSKISHKIYRFKRLIYKYIHNLDICFVL